MGDIMPSAAPAMPEASKSHLKDLGEQIHLVRKNISVSATVAAEAAGISRMTLHRIERGEASVTMGAYLSAMSAVGLEPILLPTDRNKRPVQALQEERILLADYPALKRLAWHLTGAVDVSARDAFELYDRNRKHLVETSLCPKESELLRKLTEKFNR